MSPSPLSLLPLACTLSLALAPAPQAPPRAEAALEGNDRRAIVEDIAAALEGGYVFPAVAEAMGEHVRSRLADGAYDGLTALSEFTEQLTADLQSISKDKHLRVRFAPAPPPSAGGGPSEAEARERRREQQRRENYGFRKIEILAGNVGYLRLDGFAPAELGGATAVAAMGLLAGSDALIIDLRSNGGGSPSMIQLLTSYLLEGRPTHINSFYLRAEDRTEQFWTHAWVPGARMPEVPVYVLTSSRTFSAAEEFTYNLKNLERATLVGETTGGGAHPVESHRVAGYPVEMMLPFGRAINPITGTNWEGTGVEPHVAVAAAAALDAAHALALGDIVEKAAEPASRTRLGFLRDLLQARQRPVALSQEQLGDYVGLYGPREIGIEGGALLYRRGQGPWLRLTPVGQDGFLVGDLDGFRIRFERDAQERVQRLVGLYDDGREEPSERTR